MTSSTDALTLAQEAATLAPGDAGAHCNLGVVLHGLGRLDEAAASYRRALQIEPEFAEAHFNLGLILQNQGRLEGAETSHRRALQVNPDFAEAHYNLGNTLKDLGRPDEAVASYRSALRSRPDFVQAHINLGSTLKDLGHLEEAEASFQRALQIKPDFAEVHYNLGNTLKDLGRAAEAEASYRRALRIKPDFSDALNNLALLLQAQGKPLLALNAIRQSLQIRETSEAKNIFVACINRLRFTHDDVELRAILVRALTESWCRPGDLMRIGIDLMKQGPDFAKSTADPLLHALLTSAPISDVSLERFLTKGRRDLLDAAAAGTPTVTDFYSMLARQCFINEYVFTHGDDEIKKAGALRDRLVAALEAGTPIPALWPIAVSAYFPLCSLPFASRLLEAQWPAEVAAVLVQQVREPAEELQLRAAIPRLTGIDDAVSLLVQNQYEENPYPRWVRTALAGQPRNTVEYLCQKFPLASFNRRGKGGGIDLLIAGCGTGQQSIETASLFEGARVLAVDLSMSSLAYAKRKSREMGVTSIEYAQADLTKLGSLGRSFDVIESVGVLHHLADPWAGWRVLLSLLRPSGFMKLGFYSELARRNILKARAFIAEKGYAATADRMRRCRQDLMALDETAAIASAVNIQDFFSMSSCRDLLFHVHEHRMTLAGIDAFLRENNLALLGFDGGADIQGYKQRFPGDRAATNLVQWQIFENENPDTFIGMYQFWIQKAG